jgi:hypothetical protein
MNPGVPFAPPKKSMETALVALRIVDQAGALLRKE